MEKYNIEALKQLATAVATSAAVVAEVMKDGKINLADLSEAPAAIDALQDFASVPFATLLPEVTDISKEEAAQLAAHFATHFDIPNNSVEAMVEAGLSILLDLAVAVKTIRDVFQKVKTVA